MNYPIESTPPASQVGTTGFQTRTPRLREVTQSAKAPRLQSREATPRQWTSEPVFLATPQCLGTALLHKQFWAALGHYGPCPSSLRLTRSVSGCHPGKSPCLFFQTWADGAGVLEGTSPNLAFSPPRTECRATGMQRMGRNRRKMANMLVQAQRELQGLRGQAALAPSRSSGSLWCCWDSPWAEAGGHIPSQCLSLLRATTQPPTYVPRPHLSPKLQISVSNWAPTPVPPGRPGTLKPSRVPAAVSIFPHPYFLLGFSRLHLVWTGAADLSISHLPGLSGPPLPPHNCSQCSGPLPSFVSLPLTHLGLSQGSPSNGQGRLLPGQR